MNTTSVMNRHAAGLISAVAALLLCAASLCAQDISKQFQLTNWTTHTSMIGVRGVCTDAAGRYWVATNGGVYAADTKSNTFTEYRNQNALRSLDVMSIAYNAERNEIFTGSFDGKIQVFSFADSAWYIVSDIEQSTEQYPKRSINDIAFRGNRAYLATDFGIVVYDMPRRVFIEVIDLIADMQPKTAVRKILLTGDSIIAATDAGVVMRDIDTRQNSTMREPQKWIRLTPPAQTTILKFTSLAIAQGGTLFASTPAAIYRRSGTTLQAVFTSPDVNLNIQSLSVGNDTLYYAMQDRIAALDGARLTLPTPSPIALHAHIAKPGGGTQFAVVYSVEGLAFPSSSGVQFIVPRSPSTNRVFDVTVDADNNVWFVTAGSGGDGQGISCLTPGGWINLSYASTGKRLLTDSYIRINAMRNGDVWASSWGAGMMRCRVVNQDSISFENFNSNNTPLRGFQNNPLYTVVGESTSDTRGNTWIAQFGNFIDNGPHIIMRDKTGAFRGYTYPGNPSSLRNFMRIQVDANNTKWLASLGGATSGSGLMYFNERNTPDDQSDDVWGFLNTSNSALATNDLNALATDKNGLVWIGTVSNGIYVIFSPAVALSGKTPTVRSLTQLRNQVINDIAVDALNQKWVATNSGVWVLNEDGTEIIAHITTKDYPALLSDEVKCIAINDNTGEVWIGTLQGLNSVSTLSLRAAAEFDLTVYPTPYIPDGSTQLVIDGIEPDAQIRIVTIDGALVRTIDTKSRRAVWDGLDENGTVVSSGVYGVLVVSRENARASAAKILVKRQ
ncbi:MAG: hypothetical protein JNL32_12820 [Candidatus Kapabacteria bacterium]|nr:hypothetical protein [Candidatus Kapabacteria bacterium]